MTSAFSIAEEAGVLLFTPAPVVCVVPFQKVFEESFLGFFPGFDRVLDVLVEAEMIPFLLEIDVCDPSFQSVAENPAYSAMAAVVVLLDVLGTDTRDIRVFNVSDFRPDVSCSVSFTGFRGQAPAAADHAAGEFVLGDEFGVSAITPAFPNNAGSLPAIGGM